MKRLSNHFQFSVGLRQQGSASVSGREKRATGGGRIAAAGSGHNPKKRTRFLRGLPRRRNVPRFLLLGSICLAGLVAFPCVAAAQAEPPVPEFFNDIGIAQRIGDPLPLDALFTDETGKEVRLGSYFGKKPVILALVYFECPMLCTMVLNGMLRAINALSFKSGADFEIVAVSFNPKDTPELAMGKKTTYVEGYRQGNGDGWHFLTGGQEAIDQLTKAVGFHYVYDEKTGQYAHASALMIITAQGRVARYLFGIEYSARDLRLALVEASKNRLGSVVEQVLLMCFQYDPSTGKYSLAILKILQVFGSLTVLALAFGIIVLVRRGKKKEL